MKEALKQLFVVALLGLHGLGCAQVIHLQTAPGEPGAHANVGPVPPASGPLLETPVTVLVQAPPMMGCLMRTNANPVEVATAKILCEFLPVESEAQGKLALRTAMPTDLGTDIYLFLDGIRDSLGAHLSRRLSERFRTPQVAVNPLPASALPFAPMARYTQPKMRFGVKRTQLTLVARVTQGANLLSGGEGRTELDKGQLGWEIPVAVVFFPIGSIVVLVTLDNREHEAMGRSVAQSLDAAAARLTAQLGEIAATSHSALSVEVGFALAPLSGFAPAPMTAPAPTGR